MNIANMDKTNMGTKTTFKQLAKKHLKKPAVLLSLCLLPLSQSFGGWETTWIERFDGEGVNWDNWTAQIQANYNNEIQCYTDDESSTNRNFEVSDGTLKITARRQNIDCPGQNGRNLPWTSGRINSKDKAEFLYGRLEARLRFSDLRGGTWPAFWMLENRIAEHPIKGDNDNVNWPNPGAGEIDVWEWYANSGDRYITNFFNVGNCGGEVRPTYSGGANDVTTFHTYAIEWTADEIKFFMDNNLVAEHDLSNCSQYEEPMFVLLNVAIGGNLGGAVDASLNSATMEVDYVAHCSASDASEWQQCNESTPMALDDDNDGVSNSQDQCPNTPPNVEVDSTGCQFFTEPQEEAPTPNNVESEVVSLYSDSYQSIESVDFNPNWGQSTTVSEEQIQGNNVLKYTALNYQGTDFEDNKQDVSSFDNIYLNYWTQDSSALKIYVISPGPRETFFEVDVVQQAWQTLVIPLSTYASVVDLSDVFQLKIEGNGTIFLDNIYFGNDTEAATDTDGDGVIDADDECPGTASGVEVDSKGCAVVAPTPAPPAPETPPATPEAESSGGSMNFLVLIALACFGFNRRVKAPSYFK
ncbi:family 16 glycosylhydrolase [Glaciecola sp. MF2-115]|uniref:glycoside hydrolase family 16 protein n=1 Tax=Glaciecola sp. MF2-115 TaxID=3384827 RepID=UPI0039A14047